MGNRVGLALGREEESQAQANVGKCLMKEKGHEAVISAPLHPPRLSTLAAP